MQVQKRKRKGEKKYCKNIQDNKAKEAENYTQALRELNCACTKKNYFSLEFNIAVLETF